MLLAIDAGNTRTKAAVFDVVGEPLWQESLPNHAIANLFIPFHLKIGRVIVANVAGKTHGEAIQQVLAEHDIGNICWAKATGLAHHVKNNYAQPSLLGVDRWAAAVAAWHLHQQPCLVVNAGTAVTIDMLQPMKPTTERCEAEFVGGVILPGMRLMHLALTQNTAELKVSDGHYANYPTGTADAIYSGACNAIIGAIALMYDRVRSEHGQATVVLSGGDAGVLVDYLKKLNINVVLEPSLVLQGLRLLEKAS